MSATIVISEGDKIIITETVNEENVDSFIELLPQRLKNHNLKEIKVYVKRLFLIEER